MTLNEVTVAWLMLPDVPAEPTTLEELLNLNRPAWHLRAACRGRGAEAFVGGEPTPGVMATCRVCPVREECFEYAVSDASMVGVWGGTTERERRVDRKVRKAVA
jgi:hypothetical protein